MKEFKKSTLINAGVLLLSAIGALLSNLAHEKEMEELKQEIEDDLRTDSEEEES